MYDFVNVEERYRLDLILRKLGLLPFILQVKAVAAIRLSRRWKDRSVRPH